MLSEQDQAIRKKYKPRSNKVLIRFWEGERNLVVRGVQHPSRPKEIQLEDLPLHYKEHQYLGLVLNVGSKIEIEEPEIKIGSKLLLRGFPAFNTICLINNEVLYAIDIQDVLCITPME